MLRSYLNKGTLMISSNIRPNICPWREGLANTLKSETIHFLATPAEICSAMNNMGESATFEHLKLERDGTYTSGRFKAENTRLLNELAIYIIESNPETYKNALLSGAGFGYEAAHLKKIIPEIELTTTSLSAPIISDRLPLVLYSNNGYAYVNNKININDKKNLRAENGDFDTEKLLDFISSNDTFSRLFWEEPNQSFFIDKQYIGPFSLFIDKDDSLPAGRFDLIYDSSGPMFYDLNTERFSRVYQSLSNKGLLFLYTNNERVDDLIAEVHKDAFVAVDWIYPSWSSNVKSRYALFLVLNPENPFLKKHAVNLIPGSNLIEGRRVLESS